MLVSPTEPAPLKVLGRTSPIPEQYGADFLFTSSEFGLVGVQRKELDDFVGSVHDGRLGTQLGMMKRLGLALLLLEGRPQWTIDGLLTSGQTRWTRAQHYGVLWSVQLGGCWVATSSTMDDTATVLNDFARWAAKPRHLALESRPGPAGDEWGRKGNREWEMHLLQGFQGIGPVQAEAIRDHFGKVPLRWEVTLADLMEVRGIGVTRAQRLLGALENGRA